MEIFERLWNGEPLFPNNPERYIVAQATLATRKLLVEMNNTVEPAVIRKLLSQITGIEIDETTNVFPPLYINYGKNTKIGKNVFINFDCTFLDLG